MKVKKLFLSIFIILNVLIALASNAPAGEGGPRGKWWNDSSISKKLNLTEKEIQKIDALYVESMRRSIDLRSAVAKERFELRNLLESKAGNEPAVIEQFKNMEKARSAIALERLRFLIKVRDILGIKRFRDLGSFSESTGKERRRKNIAQ